MEVQERLLIVLIKIMVLPLSFIKACRYFFVSVLLLQCLFSYGNEHEAEVYGSGNFAVCLHGDTLSWLVCSGHFYDARVMHTALSYTFTVEDDTIKCSDRQRSQFSPLTVYSNYSYIDELKAINTTPKSYTLLNIFSNAYLLTDYSNQKWIPTIDILNYPRTIEMSEPTEISDLYLNISGISFPLRNYYRHIGDTGPMHGEYPLKALVYYDVCDIIRALKFKLLDNNLIIYDWLSNKLGEFKMTAQPILLIDEEKDRVQ